MKRSAVLFEDEGRCSKCRELTGGDPKHACVPKVDQGWLDSMNDRDVYECVAFLYVESDLYDIMNSTYRIACFLTGEECVRSVRTDFGQRQQLRLRLKKKTIEWVVAHVYPLQSILAPLTTEITD